jgi:hypothetical protein
MQRVLIDWITEVANDNSGEENSGGAESDPAKLQTAKRHAEDADKRERPDGVGNRLGAMKFKEPAHRGEKCGALSDVAKFTRAAPSAIGLMEGNAALQDCPARNRARDPGW